MPTPTVMSAAPLAKPSAAAVATQVKKGGVTTFRKPRLRPLLDETFAGVTGVFFGPSGSGKTVAFVDIMCEFNPVGAPPEAAKRAIYVNTDIGQGGFPTVKAELKARGRLDLIPLIQVMDIESYEQMQAWLDEPWDPEILAFDPAIFYWDGFGTFQSVDLVEYVLDNAEAGGRDGTSALREAGLVMEKVGKDQSWEARKRATVRMVDKFGSMRHPQGRTLHRFLTMFELSSQVTIDPGNPTAGSKQVLQGKPLLSGFSTWDQIKGAATFVVSCRKIVSEGGKSVSFKYYTAGPNNLEGKVQGVSLDVEIEAKAGELVRRVIDAFTIEAASEPRTL